MIAVTAKFSGDDSPRCRDAVLHRAGILITVLSLHSSSSRAE